MEYEKILGEVMEWLDTMEGYGVTDFSFADNGDSFEINTED